MSQLGDQHDRIAITGIGMIASVGNDRESVWQAVQQGRSGVRSLTGIPEIPDHLLIGAPVDISVDVPGGLKVIALCQQAAAEAIADANLYDARVPRDRFGCAISGHIGDLEWLAEQVGRNDLIPADKTPWNSQWLPNTACNRVATRHQLMGPRLCHSTACVSGLVDILAAVRAVHDNQCDVALAGSGEVIHPLMAAGFRQLKVLAHHDDPTLACRPFDSDRSGFVMGEGAAMFVVERLSHALRRGAHIYAEIVASTMLAEAHHLTGVDTNSETLAYLIASTLRKGKLGPSDISYINAHGTGTHQNDIMETRGIRRALGDAANQVCLSSTKSMIGHLVSAAGSVELAITALALRDGFTPPTVNLTHQDPECDLDCIPMFGRHSQIEHALKLSVAFGGHMVAVALRRWDNAGSGIQRPSQSRAA